MADVTMYEHDLPVGEIRVRPVVGGTEVLVTVTGQPDELWCELFPSGPREGDDLADAIVSAVADPTGYVFLVLATTTSDGEVVRALEWLREAATETSIRRKRFQAEADRVRHVAVKWAREQIVADS
jgi:hypothetical protein